MSLELYLNFTRIKYVIIIISTGVNCFLKFYWSGVIFIQNNYNVCSIKNGGKMKK